MYPLSEHERELDALRQARRLAHQVAQIPRHSRETLERRLKDQGKDPSDDNLWREWLHWRHLVRRQRRRHLDPNLRKDLIMDRDTYTTLRSLFEEFGEDPDPGMIPVDGPPAQPAERSGAARIVARVDRDEQARAKDRARAAGQLRARIEAEAANLLRGVPHSRDPRGQVHARPGRRQELITMTAKNLDPTGRKPPAQPKVRSLKPNPQPPARKLKLATRDPRAGGANPTRPARRRGR